MFFTHVVILLKICYVISDKQKYISLVVVGSGSGSGSSSSSTSTSTSSSSRVVVVLRLAHIVAARCYRVQNHQIFAVFYYVIE